MKNVVGWFTVLALVFVFSSNAFAAAPDGTGPWADEVVSSSQSNTKAAGPVSTVSPGRSNPSAALGVAENDSTVDANFFSLGFGGSITLKFDNGIRDGVISVESTNATPAYPIEKASIEVSADGTTWVSAGNVDQTGQVAMPESLSCVNYVRVTDISNPDDFTEDTADGYDVDGVQAVNAESCDPQTTGTPTPTPTNTPSDNGGNNGGGGNNNSGTPPVCSDAKPGTPAITSVRRTSGATAEVSWTSVTPVTHYVLSYGTGGNYQYGVPNTGNVTTFVVGGLSSGTNYEFRVYAVNGCMPGDPSGNSSSGSVLGTSTGGGDVLGASTDTLAATGTFARTFREMSAAFAAIAAFVLVFFMKRSHEAV